MVRAETRDRECWHCSGRTGLALVCGRCEAPQPLAPGVDLFAVLGLKRRLVVEPDDLERRYHEASRAVHPDRHQTAGEPDRTFSLAASAAVNRAYRTLRDPIARGRYWLELHGTPLGERNNQVPPALAELVFETQEQLAELRGASDPAAARRGIESALAGLDERLRGLVAELEARYAAWDGAGGEIPDALAELKRRLSEIAYLNTLRDDVDETLDSLGAN
jgi:molecular chaperone HscB